MRCSDIFVLKSPASETLSYLLQVRRTFLRLLKKYSSLCYDGWYIQHGSHLHFLKLSTTKILSTSF